MDDRFVFELTALDESASVSQVAHALEVRVELYSRDKLPGLWERLDRASASSAGMPVKKRSRLLSAVILLLGAFLLVTGLAEPMKLSFLIIVGAFAVLYGASGLLAAKTAGKPSKYEREAAALLKGRGELEAGHVSVAFSGSGMVVTVDGSVESFECAALEFAVEEDDLFVVGFAGRAVVLQKCDLVVGEVADFARFLGDNVKLCRAAD